MVFVGWLRLMFKSPLAGLEPTRSSVRFWTRKGVSVGHGNDVLLRNL